MNFLFQEAMAGALQGPAPAPVGEAPASLQKDAARSAPKRVHAGQL